MNFLKHQKFLFTSTNQHGVHSPFVFNYLTKCLYQKTFYRKSKTIDILLKSIAYFEYRKFEIRDTEDVKELISQKFSNSTFDSKPFDLIFAEHINSNIISDLIAEKKMHNDSMVLINNIHKNKNTSDLWNQINSDEKATVTIDFFYCGVLFFRQEQVKEHFKIRI